MFFHWNNLFKYISIWFVCCAHHIWTYTYDLCSILFCMCVYICAVHMHTAYCIVLYYWYGITNLFVRIYYSDVTKRMNMNMHMQCTQQHYYMSELFYMCRFTSETISFALSIIYFWEEKLQGNIKAITIN